MHLKSNFLWTMKAAELGLLSAVTVCLVTPSRLGSFEKPRFCKSINETTDRNWPWATELECEAAGSIFEQMYPYDWYYDQILRVLFGLLFVCAANKLLEVFRLLLQSEILAFTVICALNSTICSLVLAFMFLWLQKQFAEENSIYQFPVPWLYASYIFAALFSISLIRFVFEYYILKKTYERVPVQETFEELTPLDFSAIPLYSLPEVIESDVNAPGEVGSNRSNYHFNVMPRTPLEASSKPNACSPAPFTMEGFGGIKIRSASDSVASLCSEKSSTDC
ncbi:hypothetical protein QR680_014393 [Steinernema hermaphroditum]|uniref:Uncharacterized protein n=1 Tax=Steinernema hermaphroditum TaxID=289476 RepID=A0AA39M455_9BILA|nr:hypothetical protein QR680_014393 [Steinernema hermaphroditum]